MMHDVIVVERVGSSIGEHRVEQFELLTVRRRKSDGRRPIPFENDGMYPTVSAVADKPDWIGSERIRPFARVRELAVPSKHSPCAD